MTVSTKRPDLREAMAALCTMRIGMAGYAAIIGSLRAGPLSTTELNERHSSVSRLLILEVMRHCRRAGIVHRVDWHRTTPHARLVPRWALGRDGDISMPMYEERTRRPKRAQSTLILLTTAMELLGENPHSRTELAEALCMNVETAYRVIKALRDNKLIHVASWHKPPLGTSVQEFALGDKPDARRPPRVGRTAETFRQYKVRRVQRQTLYALAGMVAAPMRSAVQ
jgi:hypothetical protein